jgi:hypothetical protein
VSSVQLVFLVILAGKDYNFVLVATTEELAATRVE